MSRVGKKLYGCCAGLFIAFITPQVQGLEIHRAVADNDLARVKKLLDRGIKLPHGSQIDVPDKHGDTPLMIAAAGGHEDMARYLLKRRAIPNRKNNIGRTALMMAAADGNANMVKILIDGGAVLDEKDRGGKSAWMLARENGHTDIVALLRVENASMTIDEEQRVRLNRRENVKTEKRGESHTQDVLAD